MNDKVSILLSTYNGEKYLKEQIDSLFYQTYKNFILIVRDDGSIDETVCILEKYKKEHNNIILLNDNKNKGVIKSFSYLLEYAVNNTNSNYFMFCDQDDVWEKNKIKITLQKMQEKEKRYGYIPILIHTDLEVVDQYMNLLHPSFWRYDFISPKYDSLNRLLMKNTITGCTMMINKFLAFKSIPIPDEAIMHDWWIGLVASYFGKIDYIKEATIKYRQHDRNSLGAKAYKKELLKNVKNVLKGIFFKRGKFYKHHKINIVQARKFLERFESELDDYTKLMLKDFSEIEEKTYFEKRKIIFKYKLFKQGIIRNLGLLLNI